MQEIEGRVLVVGGSGFYGTYLVKDLLEHTRASITVVSRRPKAVCPETGRVKLAVCDLKDLSRLTGLARGCDVVVHCAGPFQRLPLNPLRAALSAGRQYVDLAEDRIFAREVRELGQEAESAGVTVVSGASVCPGLEALFALGVRGRFDRVTSIRTIAAPDTRKHRGPAMFYTMLWGVGRGWDEPRGGEMRRVYGWTEPEWVEFPRPVGSRLTYLVLEMANLDVLPETFGVGTVAFKAGTEHWWLNRMLQWSALLRARTGFPAWERMSIFVRGLSWLAGLVGKDEGGVIFEVGGIRGGKAAVHRLALMAERDGGFIPSALAAIVTEEILSGRLRKRGVVPVEDWIEPRRLVGYLLGRGLRLWEQESLEGEWKQVDGIS
ncbi:MAG TPA: saccharopine dehydrogenase NADP-binding domain-containing protein [Phycisphaerae bacterium]|nr:saccharopine dehydrogenase NADP-binding domain-containing protein [Phycisphaerae bacterium]